jgi:hypothetical protein
MRVNYAGGVRGVVVCACLLAGGCDGVLGLGDIHPMPDASDAPVFDAPVDVFYDAACTTKSVLAVADAPIFMSLPTQDLSKLGVVTVGSDLTSVGVFKFDVTTLPAGYNSLTLVLAYGAHDDNCNSPCGSCDAIDIGGTFDVYPMRSDWQELVATTKGVTWNDLYSTVPWQVPGALGAQDRGAKLGTFPHTKDQDTQVRIAGTALAETALWIRSNLVSFQVVNVALGAGGAKLVVRSHEHTCDPGTLHSQLIAEYCP